MTAVQWGGCVTIPMRKWPLRCFRKSWRRPHELQARDRVAAVHRVGELEVGDVSVAIVVSSPHRAEAYDASRYIIEEIKKRLPVWKKERYSDGAEEWVEGRLPRRRTGAPPGARDAPPGTRGAPGGWIMIDQFGSPR